MFSEIALDPERGFWDTWDTGTLGHRDTWDRGNKCGTSNVEYRIWVDGLRPAFRPEISETSCGKTPGQRDRVNDEFRISDYE